MAPTRCLPTASGDARSESVGTRSTPGSMRAEDRIGKGCLRCCEDKNSDVRASRQTSAHIAKDPQKPSLKKGSCFAKGYQGRPDKTRGNQKTLRNTGRQRGWAWEIDLAHAYGGGRGVRDRADLTLLLPDQRCAPVREGRANPAHPPARSGAVPRRADDGLARRSREVAPPWRGTSGARSQPVYRKTWT